MLFVENVDIPEKYAHFLDLFSQKSAAVLFNYLDINKLAIYLKLDKQLSHRPIYSLGLIELEILRLILQLTWSIGLFNCQNYLQKHLFFL